MDEDETNERHWIQGNRAAWQRILGEAVRELSGSGAHGEDPALVAARHLLELEDTRRTLRSICEEHGDNDWSDDLYLSDALEKHLGRHLYERAK